MARVTINKDLPFFYSFFFLSMGRVQNCKQDVGQRIAVHVFFFPLFFPSLSPTVASFTGGNGERET